MIEPRMMTGPRLRELRRRRGWSQNDLARRTQLSVAAIRHWEAGRRQVRPAMAELLYRVLEEGVQ